MTKFRIPTSLIDCIADKDLDTIDQNNLIIVRTSPTIQYYYKISDDITRILDNIDYKLDYITYIEAMTIYKRDSFADDYEYFDDLFVTLEVTNDNYSLMLKLKSNLEVLSD